MSRVERPASAGYAGLHTSIRSAAAASKTRKHKVVLESVTQERKKLRSVLTFQAKPPPGYTFIPAGNPELTNAMKEFARKGNHDIYAVSTTPHQRSHDLSKEVHRVGFHFPSIVVAQVCAHYGIELSAAGTLVTNDNLQAFRQRRQNDRSGIVENTLDQVTINTQARDAIRDLFPNIPDNDLHQIIKTAFQKGHKKVGTANELSLTRRAQLSVVAHIRHVYTDYDRFLKVIGYHEARHTVEGPTLKKLVEWRGDEDNGNKVLEDVFREVIVISDDEDSDADPEDQSVDDDEQSLEVTSDNANDRQTETKNTSHAQPLSPHERDRLHKSDDEAPLGYRYVPRISRRRKRSEAENIDRHGQSRYAAWDRAREQYRANPIQLPTDHLFASSVRRQETGLTQPELIEIEADRRPQNQPQSLSTANATANFRNIQDLATTNYTARKPSPPFSTARVNSLPMQSHPIHRRGQSLPRRLSPQPFDGDSVVLPSIEGSELIQNSTRRNDATPWALTHQVQAEKTHTHVVSRPTRCEIIDLTSSYGQPPTKKRKLETTLFDLSEPYAYEAENRPAAKMPISERGYISTPSRPFERSLVGREHGLVETRPERPDRQMTGFSDRPAPVHLQYAQSSALAFRDLGFPISAQTLHRPDEMHPTFSDRVLVSNLSKLSHLDSSLALQSPRFVSPPRDSFVSFTRPHKDLVKPDLVRSTALEEAGRVDHGLRDSRIPYPVGRVAYQAAPSDLERRHDGVGRQNGLEYRHDLAAHASFGHHAPVRQAVREIKEHRDPTSVREYIPVDQTRLVATHREAPARSGALYDFSTAVSRQPYSPSGTVMETLLPIRRRTPYPEDTLEPVTMTANGRYAFNGGMQMHGNWPPLRWFVEADTFA